MITWITPNIAIGEYRDACNRELIKKEKIDCVLSLRIIDDEPEPLMLMKMGVEYYKIPVGRHQGLEPIRIELKVATYMLELLADRYKRILVHCTACMDRTPFVVASYIANLKYYNLHNTKYRLEEGYKYVREKRPNIIEHYEWVSK